MSNIKPPNSDITPPSDSDGMCRRLPRRDITISLSSKDKEDAQIPKAASTNTKTKKPLLSLLGKKSHTLLLTAVGVASVFIVVLAGSAWLLGGVEVVVTPKERTAEYSGTLAAVPTGSDEEGNVVYQTTNFSDTEFTVVPATERKKVSERATGRIVIYNDFNDKVQRLIKNTRFETPDGRIYRIYESVNVPGQKDEGGETVPGSIEVAVFADETGENYNIGLTDFTIPGFEGTARFAGFYARSKTPMSGGFEGERLVAEEGMIENAIESLEKKLTERLEVVIHAELPEGAVVLREHDILFEKLPLGENGDGVEVGMKGVLKVDYVDEGAFAGALASFALLEPPYDGAPVSFHEPREFTHDVVDEVNDDGEVSPPSPDGKLMIAVSGTVHFVWDFDSSALARDLAGVASADMDSVMEQGHVGIKNATASFHPFCIRCIFPDDPDKIDIVIMEDGN